MHYNKKVFLLLLLLPFSLQAHHSTTHFSDEVTEMEGVLSDLSWKNPHVYFYVDVEEDGVTKTWELEAGTIYMIGRAGVTRDLFTVGERIRIAGNKSNVYDDKFWLTNVMGEDGKEILVVARGQARWADEVIGGRGQWTNDAFVKEGDAVEGNGIFRVWSPATGDVAPLVTDGPAANRLNAIATDAAREAGETWDPYAFDDACEIPGLPRANFGPHPHQFMQDGDNILILNEEFHLTRTVHMNSELNPEDQAMHPLGFSVGRWENDNTLVIDTSRISYPYMNLGGIGQSEQVTLTERYVLSEDESQVDFEVIVNDPIMLTEPYVQRGVWIDIGEVISGDTYDCDPKEGVTQG